MSPCTFLELFEAVEAMERDEGAPVRILTGAEDPDSHDQLIPYAREMALRLIPPAGAWMAVHMAKQALHKPLLRPLLQPWIKRTKAFGRLLGPMISAKP
jgi:hypothetical protein